MKDWSEYTLVSFGDSYTFGQDTIYHKQSDVLHGQEAVNTMWKSQCNELSYTQVLSDRMGFKNNLNFGIQGGSSERALMTAESFLRSNPELKIFVLFNFTSPSRFMNMFKLTNESMYSLEKMAPHASNWLEDNKYNGINKKSIQSHYTYFRNEMQDVYCHIKDKRALYHLLSTYNVPHTTFDILNDMDSRMLRDNPMQYIVNDAEPVLEDMYNNDGDYVFTEMDYFNSYYKELIDNSSLLSHIGIDYLTNNSPEGSRNVLEFLGNLGMQNYGKYDAYKSEHGAHWGHEGHIEVAKLVEKYINENYN
jgi:hypothetical protein